MKIVKHKFYRWWVSVPVLDNGYNETHLQSQKNCFHYFILDWCCSWGSIKKTYVDEDTLISLGVIMMVLIWVLNVSRGTYRDGEWGD